MPLDTTARLNDLRGLMKREGIQAYVIPTDDAHASEYVAACDMRREWISGFTGSAGTAVVLEDSALLFTDGRYHQQAEKELCSAWTLQKFGVPGVANWQEKLASLQQKRIGLDPTLLSISDYQTIVPTLAGSSSFVPVEANLVDELWHDRPLRPHNEVFVLDAKYAGKGVDEKLQGVRKELAAGPKKVKGLVVSMLDEICWLFNLRGSDIPFNPVFFSFAYVPLEGSPTLFINVDQLSQGAYQHLMTAGVLVEPYDSVVDHLKRIGSALADNELVLTPSKTNLALCNAIGTSKIATSRGPVGDLKAIKNETEIEGFRQCHIRDGVALTRYFSWLERQLENGAKLQESQAADQLEKYRSELPLFKGLSFDTISSTGANASVIHYHPDPVKSAVIDKDQIYLCDSGAQFFDGTTDTTRTLHFGTPTAKEKRANTRVLQGHIAIDQLVFPSTATGYILDSFARRPLWTEGLDYRHGTGHGVGSFLNVHEGPHGIGTRVSYNDVKLKAGMTVSNEPGYYEDGSFGIRIENIVIVQPAQPPNNFGDVGFLKMEHVTMVPIQTKLVELDLLSPDERKWLNSYNSEVRTALEGLIRETGDTEAVEYLIRETEPL